MQMEFRGTTDCPICGMHFSLDDADDVKRVHSRHCRRFLDLQARYGVQNNADQAADKSRGHGLMHDGKTVSERVEGALLLLKAWYDRYLLGHDDEPSFESWAADFDIEKEFSWCDGVVGELRRLFPRHRPAA